MAVNLTGNIKDLTTLPPEDHTDLVVKASRVTPTAYGVTTTAPRQVKVSDDGGFTVTAEEGVKGWLYLSGAGWSDSIPFIAAAGMTYIWEAVANALGYSSSMVDYLDIKSLMQRMLDEAVAAVPSSLRWNRGKISVSDMDELTKPGWWEIESYSQVRKTANLPVMDISAAAVEVIPAGGGRMVQVLRPVNGDGVREVWSRLRASTGAWTPWTLEHDVQIRALKKSDDLNTATLFTTYVVDDWDVVASLVNAPSKKGASAVLTVIPAGGGRIMQTWVETTVGGVGATWRRLRNSSGEWEEWQNIFDADLSGDDDSRRVVTHGDSQVGADYSWPNRLGEGVDVVNYGQSGATPEQVLLHDGAIGVVLPKISIPKGGSATVPVEGVLPRQDKSTAYVLQDGEQMATLVHDPQAETWTLSSTDGFDLAESKRVYAARRYENDGARHIVWFGGNAIRTGLHHPGETVTQHVMNAYARALEAFGPETIVCGYVPAYGDEAGTAVADELNAWLARVVPTQFLDMRRHLQIGAPEILGEPLSEQDQTDIASGWLPRGMYRDDGVHLKDEAHQWIARLIVSYPEGATPRLAIGIVAA